MRNYNKDEKQAKIRNGEIVKRKRITKNKKMGCMKININNYGL